MSKSPILVLAVCGLLAGNTQAQQPSTPRTAPKATPAPPKTPRTTPPTIKIAPAQSTPAAPPLPPVPPAPPAKAKPATPPAATPAADAKKSGIFSRMFGKKAKTPEEPTPAPKATPAPKKRVVDPAPKPENAKTEPSVKPAPAEEPGAAAVVAVKPRRGKKGHQAAAAAPGNPAAESQDPEVVEKLKYNEVKAKALEDPDVKELKAKADATLTEEDGRKALRSYNRALFAKMRQIDPSLEERVTLMEAAVMKYLSESQ